MKPGKLKVLLIVEQCNPEWTSVPLVGFRYYSALSQLADVTLVTHERNEKALAKVAGGAETIIIPESPAIRRYFRVVGRITEHGGRINWPMRHTLGYPVYAEFNRKVFQRFSDRVSRGAYDVVHAFSPIIPRYPVKIIDACRNTPFVLGPVNGGLLFPSAFKEIARKEFDRFNFIRTFSRFIPGYSQTYRRADKILAGSTATLAMLRKMFAIVDNRIELFHENGVQADCFGDRTALRAGGPIRLLFVGRLMPYKCADVVIEAVSQLQGETKQRVTLTIVGDGPEKGALQRQASNLGLSEQVSFPGWVTHEQTAEFYRQSDIFCFPSIREFGGAVVLEGMAAGLPCIVADYGGIAEYVTEETGFKIAPLSRAHLVDQMAKSVAALAWDVELHARMSARAAERAWTFEWSRKASRIVQIYQNLIRQRSVDVKHAYV